MFIAAVDLDAFYCAVEQKLDPSLRGQPFCVVQKKCVATLSYEARALGIRKLSNVDWVLKNYPYVRLVNGENLAKYRQAGTAIFEALKHIIGQESVERLGLEEFRFDLTREIAVEQQKFPRQLAQWVQNEDFMDEVGGYGADLEIGGRKAHFPDFYFRFDGETWPAGHSNIQDCPLGAYIAAHMATYIRDKIWLELGFSCSIGVASSKNLAKMACGQHKPHGVTVLLPGHESEFVKTQQIRKVPGLGRACQELLGGGDRLVEDVLSEYTEQAFVAKLAPVIGAHAPALYSLLIGEDADGHAIKGYTRPQQISMEESACYDVRETKRLSEQVVEQAALDWYNDDTESWDFVPKTAFVVGDGKSRSAPFTWAPNDRTEAISMRLAALALKLARELESSPRVLNVGLRI